MVKLTFEFFEFSDQQWHLDHKEDLCSMTAEGIVRWHKNQCEENVFDLFCHKGSMGKRICTILLSNASEAEKKERLSYFLGNLGLYIPLKEKYGDSLSLSFFTPPPPSITEPLRKALGFNYRDIRSEKLEQNTEFSEQRASEHPICSI